MIPPFLYHSAAVLLLVDWQATGDIAALQLPKKREISLANVFVARDNPGGVIPLLVWYDPK